MACTAVFSPKRRTSFSASLSATPVPNALRKGAATLEIFSVAADSAALPAP